MREREIVNDRRTAKIDDRRTVANETGACDRCPPHRQENARKSRSSRRSWKDRTNKEDQYK